MPNSESGSMTWYKLDLISKRAREDSRLQFTSLAHLLDEGFLTDCYYRLGRERASGVDNVTWKEYGEKLVENLRDLVARMKVKRYKPQPAKRVYIPKDGAGRRPLGLPSLEDKIVQKGMALIMEAIYEADFLDCSYGFRPVRSCHQALNAIDKTIMTKPINHIVDADIKGFFDNVSHEMLLKFLKVRIVDPSFLLLIRRFLKAGYMEAGYIVLAVRGTPQGSIISPILSNVYLHYVLDLWYEKVLRKQVRGQCYLVRYADDFVGMVQFQDDAAYIMRALTERFAKFELELHPEKTRVISFGRYERENAKRQNRKPNTFDFLGFTHFCGKSRKGNFIVGRKTSRKCFQRSCKAMNKWLRAIRNTVKTKEWWSILRAKLLGYYQYYGVSGNMLSLRRYYTRVLRLVFKWLNRRSQRKAFNWLRFRDYLEHYPLPAPRITYNMYTLSPVT